MSSLMKSLSFRGNGGSSSPIEQLEDDDVAFLEQLKAEADTPLGKSSEQEATHKRWNTFLERHAPGGDALTKADLYAADRLVLEMASAEELWAQAPGLYQRYCEERGEAVDSSDLAMKRRSPGSTATPEEVESLRARLLQILRSLHWAYTFAPLREKRRVKLIEEAMRLMVVATVIVAGVAALLTALDKGRHGFYGVLATVVYAGVMGGAVSCTRRLGAIPTNGDALGSIYALRNSGYVLYFAPLTGAVFAVVTMLLFLGGVLKGAIFPAFEWVGTAGAADGVWPFTTHLLPANKEAYALLFLWCFIAGFAERFIPDTLTQLTQRATAQSGTGTAAPSAAQTRATTV